MLTPDLPEHVTPMPVHLVDEPHDHDLDESEEPENKPADPEQDGASDHTPPEED